jgi:hypothetical protein
MFISRNEGDFFAESFCLADLVVKAAGLHHDLSHLEKVTLNMGPI